LRVLAQAFQSYLKDNDMLLGRTVTTVKRLCKDARRQQKVIDDLVQVRGDGKFGRMRTACAATLEAVYSGSFTHVSIFTLSCSDE